jgi:hypothetical protein
VWSLDMTCHLEGNKLYSFEANVLRVLGSERSAHKQGEELCDLLCLFFYGC